MLRVFCGSLPGPSVSAEVDTVTENHHAFAFQQNPLFLAGRSDEGNSPLCVEHAVPGDISPGGDAVKGIPRKPGLSREPGQRSNVSIRSDPPRRNPAHRCPDGWVCLSPVLSCHGLAYDIS